jgi:hypothetical protein
VAGPLSFGASLIVQRVLTMPLRSRRMILESLESRQLLSVSPTSAEVSALAKSKPLQVVGSLTGTETGLQGQPAIALKATGELGMLGPVQLQSTIPLESRARNVFTLTSAQGTMTFTAKDNHGVFTLKLMRQHSGAFAGWTGTGRLVQTTVPGPIPPPPQSATVGLSLQLTLKT